MYNLSFWIINTSISWTPKGTPFWSEEPHWFMAGPGLKNWPIVILREAPLTQTSQKWDLRRPFGRWFVCSAPAVGCYIHRKCHYALVG